MRHRVVAAAALALVGLAACGGGSAGRGSSTASSSLSPTAPATTATPAISPAPSTTAASELPPLATFRDHPTDRFIVDMDVVKGGHPYKGELAATPHTGAHVHFDDDYLTWPKGGTAPSNYPPIYAVADGIVTHIEKSFHVGSNDRYGINLAIAQDGATRWEFEYSIEPMTPEPSPGFYAGFMLVKEGDHVKKGQVIAYMYTPPKANGTHIHFELMPGNGGHFAAPAIFTRDIVQQFHDHWAGFGLDGERGAGAPMAACMGWKLAAEENPFGTGAVDCL